MSLIAGWIDFNKNLENETIILDKISTTPKLELGKGIYTKSNAALISRQKENSKPLCVKRGEKEYIAVIAGCFFNADELFSELSSLGYDIIEKSNEELVIYSYLEWGYDFLTKLNGVFSLAIWENSSKTLLLARDRVGAKPLFFYKYDGGIIFASLIKTLLSSGIIKKEVNFFGLKQLLLLGPARIPGCGIISGVEEVKMGEYLIFNSDGMKKNSYWKIQATPHLDNLEKTVENTRELVLDSIDRQLKTSKNPACMLSGGLDSSIISMAAAKNAYSNGEILDTYSVDYEGNENNFVQNSFQPSRDDIYINMMTKFIGSNHKYFVLDNLDVAKSVIDAVDARDLPGMGDIDSSLLLFLRKIKLEHEVCLSGECADELLGGYPWYHKEELLYKDTFPWSDANDMRIKLFSGAKLDNAEEFVRQAYQDIISNTTYLEDDKHERRIREMFMLNFYYFMQTLIDRSDRMSVYAGVDVLVPFCDYRIIEYAYNMPWKYKALYGREKGILREAFKDLLPDDIVFRKKNPYPKTYSPIFNEYVTVYTKKLINDKESILYDLVDKNFFDDLAQNKITFTNPWYGQLMRTPQIFAYLIQLDAFFKNNNLTLA